MGFLWVIVVICGIGFIGCMIGLSLSIKNRNKEKKLQAAADYNFESRNGSYSFKYMVKGFNSADGKKIKIVINPVLGFSDLTTSSTNSANSAKVVIKGKTSGKTETKEFQLASLNPNLTMPVGTELSNEVLDVEVSSVWTLGGSRIEEKINFTYSK